MKKHRWLIPTVALLGLLGFELYRSNTFIEVEQIAVARSDIPRGFDGFKIAHLSDLHAKQYGENNAELVELLRAENPDIIAFTGDFVDFSDEDAWMVYDTAVALMSVAPVYFVPGNHEYAKGFTAVETELKRAGVVVLRNQAVELERGGDRIVLLGIDDPNGYATMLPMDETVELAKQREPDFILMLNHRYDRAEAASALGVPLMLAGHAHGGLIRLPFTDGLIGPGYKLFPQRTDGLYDVDGMSLVVSRGLGNAVWSMRLFNRPHLPIITLKSE